MMPESNIIEFNTASFMYDFGTFEFLLEIQKDTRVASTSVTIYIVKVPPPTMNIT